MLVLCLALLFLFMFAVPVFAGVWGEIWKKSGGALVGLAMEHLIPLALTLGFGLLGATGALIIKTMSNVSLLLNAIVNAASDNKFSAQEVRDIKDAFWIVVSPFRKTPAKVGPVVIIEEPPPYDG
jgi:hypothetical protein